jgi:hypothetical protein
MGQGERPHPLHDGNTPVIMKKKKEPRKPEFPRTDVMIIGFAGLNYGTIKIVSHQARFSGPRTITLNMANGQVIVIDVRSTSPIMLVDLISAMTGLNPAHLAIIREKPVAKRAKKP